MGFQIAIDGPSGSGKSSVAKAAAKELGLLYIDTGAMYRAVGLFALNSGNGLHPETVERQLAQIDIRLAYEHGEQHIYMNGADVTRRIRTQPVAEASSQVAAIEAVRLKLTDMQRQLARNHDIIMDGRDIGTHVLPTADLKIYLDATIDVRTERRCAELNALHIACQYDQIRQEIIKRDANDRNRTVSPLRIAPDAIFLDTSTMNPDEVLDAVTQLIREKRKTADENMGQKFMNV